MWLVAGTSELSEGERSVLLLHPHWKTILGPALILVAVVLAGLAAAPGHPVPVRP